MSYPIQHMQRQLQQSTFWYSPAFACDTRRASLLRVYFAVYGDRVRYVHGGWQAAVQFYRHVEIAPLRHPVWHVGICAHVLSQMRALRGLLGRLRHACVRSCRYIYAHGRRMPCCESVVTVVERGMKLVRRTAFMLDVEFSRQGEGTLCGKIGGGLAHMYKVCLAPNGNAMRPRDLGAF